MKIQTQACFHLKLFFFVGDVSSTYGPSSGFWKSEGPKELETSLGNNKKKHNLNGSILGADLHFFFNCKNFT